MVQELVTTDLFITGILAMILGAAFLFKNWAAAVGWALTVMVAVFVGVFNLPGEYFWLSVLGTVTLLVAGIIVRWMA